MTWHSPQWLYALWLVPLLAGLAWYSHRRQRAMARRFADAPMLSRIAPAIATSRTWIKSLLLIAGLSCLIAAVARPQFGMYYEQVASRGVDLFVALDVSRSMLAEDVAPNRLERAKSDILDLLEELADDRVGLIAFAGTPSVVAPLTTDHGFFRMALRELDPDTVPRGGSNIGDAIRRALAAMPQQAGRDQFIVLISDGEDQDSRPVEAARQAAERNVRVITVGLGDIIEGARIPAGSEDQRTFVRHQGQEVWSKLDETLLKGIALATSGAYVPARTRSYDLGKIYDQYLSGVGDGELTEETRRRYAEQYQWFAGAGVLLLLLELLISPTKPTNDGTDEVIFGADLLRGGSARAEVAR